MVRIVVLVTIVVCLAAPALAGGRRDKLLTRGGDSTSTSGAGATATADSSSTSNADAKSTSTAAGGASDASSASGGNDLRSDYDSDAYAVSNPAGSMCGYQAWGTAGGTGAGIGGSSPICELREAHRVAFDSCLALVPGKAREQACEDAADLQHELARVAQARALPAWLEKVKRFIPLSWVFWR